MTFGNPKPQPPWSLESSNGRDWLDALHPNGSHEHGARTSGPDANEFTLNGYRAPDATDETLTDATAPVDEFQRIKMELDCVDPWQIIKVTATFDSPMDSPNRVDIWLHQTQGSWPCPLCQQMAPGRGQTSTRVFRSLTREPETNIFVRVPIFDCPTHGPRLVLVPWAQKPDKWQYLRDLED